ncbi:aminodeoxychorismate lyase [Acinetobacter sp. CFCC 10889]|uniref:aminodeoxychorismate lyase n=1 Tax=Acinetobacter sp. CFCC 10889 TaxID=1775557 RepID=UPI000DD0A81A|nr:aminodeoxychorismate lyase [Acinetobacter sp. CFCC 10889]
MVFCYKNGQIIDSVSIFDRAFQYGDGCFSTARIYQNVIELEDLHRLRLQHSAERLFLQVDFAFLEQSLRQLQQQFDSLNGTLKIVISRGEGQRGYAMPDHPADLYVFYYPQKIQLFQPEYIDSGVLTQRIGLTMPALVGLKSLNRLEQVMLKKEAQEKAWIEALVTDVQGKVVEGVSSNCFIQINNTWISPELRYNGVHGVMRAEILQRMQQQHIPCQLRSVDLNEIPHIQSLFFCNALSPMKIVQSLDGRTLALQPCVELFETLQLQQFKSHV